MSPDPPRGRFEFWVRFVFGALVGTLLSLFLFWRLFRPVDVGWWALPPAAVFFGLVAAIWGDGFWRFLLGLFRWW